MLSPASLHLRERRNLRHGALAATLLAGALLAAGCDRQPKPDTSAMADPALAASSGQPNPVTGESTTVADATPNAPTTSSTGAAAGTGITPSKDPLAVPGSAGTTTSSASGADGSGGGLYGGGGDLPATSAGKAAPGAAALDAVDRAFLEKAAADGLFEVEAGKLAARQGKSEAVKAYGAMLSSDHASAGSQLKNLAAGKGVTVPDALPAEKQTALDTLGRATTDFDKEFVRTVGIRAHQDAVALFEKASKESKDPDIKSFAAQTLPTLKAHLEAARKLPPGKS
jgi:putative membrane protein